ncbi:uncharacterized protein LOC119351806 [Triticum dicoccoides]|uniref:uncharacterized protein LOC119351806 n=1 Tax=Triticum dicoccoides TaxID=85692 RepID=UPI00188FF1A3|nr:uncharacterized protein LOC119351806 [Triticum dicoccoides]
MCNSFPSLVVDMQFQLAEAGPGVAAAPARSEEPAVALLGGPRTNAGDDKAASHHKSTSNFLGEVGFGPVYMLSVDGGLRPGLASSRSPSRCSASTTTTSSGSELLAKVMYRRMLRHLP